MTDDHHTAIVVVIFVIRMSALSPLISFKICYQPSVIHQRCFIIKLHLLSCPTIIVHPSGQIKRPGHLTRTCADENTIALVFQRPPVLILFHEVPRHCPKFTPTRPHPQQKKMDG
jgi:hypothetical protein